MSTRSLSRREFLRVAALSVTCGTLAACAPQVIEKTIVVTTEPKVVTEIVKETEVVKETQVVKVEVTPTPKPTQAGPYPITVMYVEGGGWEKDYVSAVKELFNADVTRLEPDDGRMNAMWASGTPPDIWMSAARDVGNMLLRKRLLDITDYVAASKLIKADDMLPCFKQHMWEGVTVGKGRLYGLVKDWSPDFTIYANKKIFDEAGVSLPAEDKPMTMQSWAELGKKLTKRQGDRTVLFGMGSQYVFGVPAAWSLDAYAMSAGGESIWSPSMDRINLVNNPVAIEALRYWTDLSKEHTTASILDPWLSWCGQDYITSNLAMLEVGYWFGGFLGNTKDQALLDSTYCLPAAKWGDKLRVNGSVWCNATAGASLTKYPDVVYKLIEWFSAPTEKPALDRAAIGWNIPPFKSLLAKLPVDTPYNKRRTSVTLSEIQYTEPPLRFNPFLYGGAGMVDDNNYANDYLRGSIKFDEMVAGIEKATNAAIKDNVDRYGG